jgi:hypothetical protein
MKKIIFLLMLPFACYSQNSTNLSTRINKFNIESIRGTDQDLAMFFYRGKHNHYRDSAEYVTVEYDTIGKTLDFYLKKEHVAYYRFNTKAENLITDKHSDVHFWSYQSPERHYKFIIENIGDNLFIITVKNRGVDYQLTYNSIVIIARLTSGVLALRQNTDSSSFRPPLLTLAQRKKLFSF